MSRKILLFLCSENFRAYVWNKGALGEPLYFQHNAEGQERFGEFLQTQKAPAYLLVDLIEEDFRQETVPHLTGANYQALIQRKFEQYYRSTPFRMARLQQRQTEGRRDDELLFSALTNPARISGWLEQLQAQKTPVIGIYSVPHASIPLIKDIDSDHLLLLTWEKNAGLRQTYFLNKRLRFSRLTPISANSSFADVIATESERTHQYLQSLSLTPQGQQLNVHIICHAKDRKELDAQLVSNQSIQYAYFDLQQLGKQNKSKNNYTDSDAAPLLLNLLATQTPRSGYAIPAHTHYFQLWQTQRGLFGLAAAIALACIVWSTLSFIEGSGFNEEIESFKSQTGRMQKESQLIVSNFPNADQQPGDTPQGTTPGATASASDMKAAVTLFRNLQHYAVPPEQILKGLTTALGNFPRIHTSKLAWQMTTVDANLPAQVITFNGELIDFGKDYRGALNYLNRFQLMLTQAGYAVTPVKLPLDFSTQGSISADIGENREKPSEFSLKITWRPQP